MGQILPLVMMAAGTAWSAAGQIRSGHAQKQLAEDNAQVAEENARTADFNAQDAVERGAVDETTLRKDVKSLIGKQRASMAAQGQDLASGSALEVQQDTAYQGELDALTVRTNAARESWGYKRNAYNYRTQATDIRKGGQVANSAAKFGAVSTILTNASDILYKKYSKAKS